MGIFITEFVKYGLFLYVFLNKKFCHLRIGIPMFLCMAAGLSGMIERRELPLLVATGCTVFVWGLCMSCAAKKRAGAILKSVFFISCIDQPLFYTAEGIFLLLDFKITNTALFFGDNLVLIFIFLICGFAKTKVHRENPKIKKICSVIIYPVAAIIMISMFMIISGIPFLVEYVQPRKEISVYFYVFSSLAYLSLACVGAAFLYIVYLNRKKEELLQKEKLLQTTQKNYYETMLAKEEDTKKFRHDMQNHFLCLQDMMEHAEIDQAKAYMSHIQEYFVQISKRSYQTGNMILDSILNYYLPVLQQDTQIEITGTCIGKIAVADVELCTIVSNLVQNAAEELKRIEGREKVFELRIHTGRKNMQIEIANSTDRPEKQNGSQGLPRTTKPEQGLHGIGLSNVEETVEKCQGIFEWNCNGGKFLVKVVLPLKEEKNFEDGETEDRDL